MDLDQQTEAKIESLLESEDIDIHQKDADGNTLLHFAARLLRIEIIESLINKNADVNAANNSGENPLCWALKYYTCSRDYSSSADNPHPSIAKVKRIINIFIEQGVPTGNMKIFGKTLDNWADDTFRPERKEFKELMVGHG